MADRLDEIEARWKDTTPGPWMYNSYSAVASLICEVTGIEAPGCFPKEGSEGYHDDWTCVPTVCWVPPSYGDTATGKHAADADAIAHAPEDIKWLVSEVRRLRGTPPG